MTRSAVGVPEGCNDRTGDEMCAGSGEPALHKTDLMLRRQLGCYQFAPANADTTMPFHATQPDLIDGVRASVEERRAT